MTTAMALLASANPVTIQQFRDALQALSISPDVCREVPTAIHLLNQRKYDAVIADLQMGSKKVLDEAHRSASNRTAVTFAISGSDAESLAEARSSSSFVFERPLSAQSIQSTLKPAYGLILREQRRYFRCPVSIPVAILRQSMPEVRCHSVNISEGGIALSTSSPLKTGETVVVQFTLPDRMTGFFEKAIICWSKTGHIGVRFVSLSLKSKCELQGWLSQKQEEMLPDFVSKQFEKVNAVMSRYAVTQN
jgi:hypothetical protein